MFVYQNIIWMAIAIVVSFNGCSFVVLMLSLKHRFARTLRNMKHDFLNAEHICSVYNHISMNIAFPLSYSKMEVMLN